LIINHDVQSQFHEAIPHPQIRRSFSKKYVILHAGGSINTDQWLVGSKEVRLGRFVKTMGVTVVLLLLFDNFHSMDEIIGVSTRPQATTVSL